MIRVWLLYILFIFLLPFNGIGQQCATDSKANSILPDQKCSPVEVDWEVTYRGVYDLATTVQIVYDWDDGTSDTVTAIEQAVPNTYVATTDHIYTSQGDKCNHKPTATLMVDGNFCSNSAQEQFVTVWDVDTENGGFVYADPDVYPVCIGSGATAVFVDESQFNCVPPQEPITGVPNNETRWIKWIYGVNNTMSSPTPVSVDGNTGPWPDTSDVFVLPGEVYGSNLSSLPITVAADNALGDEFQIRLLYWNTCNKYTEGKDPVIDNAWIRIVDLPDASIKPVGTFCEFNSNVFLEAQVTPGGTWSGMGIVNDTMGEFSPSVAGPGTHEITYNVTSAEGCSNSGKIDIEVRDSPDGFITPVDPFCIYDAPFDMEAVTPNGTWLGNGITNTSTGLFDPSDAGIGTHKIIFNTAPDGFGCFGTDTVDVQVVDIPSAGFLTSDSAWCIQASNQTTAEIMVSGTAGSTFDLVLWMRTEADTLFNVSGDTSITLDNQPGLNEYRLVKIIENSGATSCENSVNDTLFMDVRPDPDITVTASFDDLCTPVEVEFSATSGIDKYSWNFGDNDSVMTTSETVSHTYTIKPEDQQRFRIDFPTDGLPDTIYYEVFILDSTFYYQLAVESIYGCRDTIYDSITIYNSPEADFFVSPEIQNYPESDVFLKNLSSFGSWSYLWDYGDGMNDTVKEPNNHVYETYGFYDIELTTYNEFCSDSIIKSVQILPPPPVAEFEPDSIGCPPLSISFSNTSQNADSYIWDFDDGRFSTEENPTHIFYQSKEHKVTLAAFGLSGSDTVERNIFIYSLPQALFTAFPLDAKSLNQVFTFTNNSIGAINYLWEFGDGNSSPEEEPTHVYREEGTFDVTLMAWSENDCVDTLRMESMITVIAGEGETNFPNAFVWTGASQSDGSWTEENINNNVFHPKVTNASKFEMEIYTRWGELIWGTKQLYKGWDGYLKTGELADPGVYVFRAEVTYISGEKEVIVGDVTFLH